MSDISYEGLDEAELIVALHAGTRPLGMGFLHDKEVTLADAREYMAEQISRYSPNETVVYRFDYLFGRPIKVSLDTKNKIILRADLYDRDAGEGACQRIVSSLLSKSGEPLSHVKPLMCLKEPDQRLNGFCQCPHCTLDVCAVCKCYEGSLTTDCSGSPVDYDLQTNIHGGAADYSHEKGWHAPVATTSRER